MARRAGWLDHVPRRGRFGPLALAVGVVLHLAGCGFDRGAFWAMGLGGAGADPVPDTLVAHAISYQRMGGGRTMVSTPALAGSDAPTVLLVPVGRGDLGAFTPPTDNQGGGPYQQLGTAHPYTRYPGSGTALYAAVLPAGSAARVISASTPPGDEVTLAAVAVKGTRITAFAWNEVLAGQRSFLRPSGNPITSQSVRTTGPATLVAIWWGDAGVRDRKDALPDSGFTVIDGVREAGEVVQCVVAVKRVEAAGTYQVRWRSTPRQGAQLWLAAVE